jgi:Tat protein translocase TatB subunit
MFGTLGGPELFLIFVVALIIFGPRKLPEIGKSLGKMMGEFRRASNDFRNTIETEVEAEKIRDSLRIEPPSVEPVSPARALAADTGSNSPEAGPDAGPAAVHEDGLGEPAPVALPVAEAVSRESAPSSPERQ